MPLMLTLCIGSKYILPQGAQSLKKEVITRESQAELVECMMSNHCEEGDKFQGN